MPSPFSVAPLLAGSLLSVSVALAQSTVRDSSGVTIVTSAAPKTTGWSIDPRPTLDFDGASESLELTAPLNIARLRSGIVVVGHGKTGQLFFLDRAGRLLATAGRLGAGPGEFKRISELFVGRADTVLVYDRSNRRLSLFSPAGAFVRSWTPEIPGSGPANHVFGTLHDGRLVLSQSLGQPPSANGITRDSMPLSLVPLGGGPAVAAGRWPGNESVIDIRTEGGKVQSVEITRLPFGRVSLVAVLDDGVAIGAGDRYEIEVRGPRGTMVRRIVRAWKPEPVTETDRDKVLELAAATGNADARARYQKFLASAPIPKTKPAYDRIVVSATGQLWVRDYIGPWFGFRPSRWSVFSKTGEWVASVEAPSRFEPLWVGPTEVLGVYLDEDDVPHVRIHALATRP